MLKFTVKYYIRGINGVKTRVFLLKLYTFSPFYRNFEQFIIVFYQTLGFYQIIKYY
jgi:hypothetical protein